MTYRMEMSRPDELHPARPIADPDVLLTLGEAGELIFRNLISRPRRSRITAAGSAAPAGQGAAAAAGCPVTARIFSTVSPKATSA